MLPKMSGLIESGTRFVRIMLAHTSRFCSKPVDGFALQKFKYRFSYFSRTKFLIFVFVKLLGV